MVSVRFRSGSQLFCHAVVVGATSTLVATAAPRVAADDLPAVEQPQPRQSAFTHGEVRLVDRLAGRIVLRHGPIENLGVPPMTMIFRVRDPRQIEGLDSGVPVRFTADRLEGAFTILHIERR